MLAISRYARDLVLGVDGGKIDYNIIWKLKYYEK